MSREITAASVHEVFAVIDGKKHSRKIEINVEDGKGVRTISENGKVKEKADMSPEEVAYFLNHDTLHGHGHKGSPFVIADQHYQSPPKQLKAPGKDKIERKARSGNKGEVVEIHNQEELGNLMSGHKIVLVLFYWPGCPPCEAFKPIYAQVASKLHEKELAKNAVFSRVSVGANWENPMVQQYNIDGVPTLLKFISKPQIRVQQVDIALSESEFEKIALNALNI